MRDTLPKYDGLPMPACSGSWSCTCTPRIAGMLHAQGTPRGQRERPTPRTHQRQTCGPGNDTSDFTLGIVGPSGEISLQSHAIYDCCCQLKCYACPAAGL